MMHSTKYSIYSLRVLLLTKKLSLTAPLSAKFSLRLISPLTCQRDIPLLECIYVS